MSRFIKGFLILSYCFPGSVQQEIAITRRPHLQPLGNPLHRQASILTIDIFMPFRAQLGDVRPIAHAQFVGDPFQTHCHRDFPAQTRRPKHLARIPFARKPKPDLIFNAKGQS